MRKLYVDILNDQKTIGITEHQPSVIINLANLGRDSSSSPVFTCGRYVCVVEATTDNKARLLFMDMKEDPSLIDTVLNEPTFINLRTKLTSLIEAYNSDYERNHNSVELVVGKPATS